MGQSGYNEGMRQKEVKINERNEIATPMSDKRCPGGIRCCDMGVLLICFESNVRKRSGETRCLFLSVILYYTILLTIVNK